MSFDESDHPKDQMTEHSTNDTTPKSSQFYTPNSSLISQSSVETFLSDSSRFSMSYMFDWLFGETITRDVDLTDADSIDHSATHNAQQQQPAASEQIVSTEVDLVMTDLASTLLDASKNQSLCYVSQEDFTSGTSYFNKMKVLHHAANKPMADRRKRRRWEHVDDVTRREVRDTWANNLDFSMVMFNSMVGYGNLQYFNAHIQNGGSAFIIPYFVFLLVLGIPLAFTEMIHGQFTGLGVTKSWDYALLFQGVGFTMLVYAVFNSMSYILRVAVSVLYMFNIFNKPLPWLSCHDEAGHPHYWNTYNCKEFDELNEMASNTSQRSSAAFLNITPAFEYFTRSVRKREYDLSTGELGDVNLPMVLFLCLTWTCVFVMATVKTRYAGKFAYVIATSTVVLTAALLARALTLEGASDGIDFFSEANWEKLGHLQTWTTAAQTIFFSLNLTSGTNTCLSSFNGFKRKTFQTSLIISVADFLASLSFAAIHMAIYGAFAKVSGVSVEMLVDDFKHHHLTTNMHSK